MAEIKFRVNERVRQFRARLQSGELRSARFTSYGLGWLISFYMAIIFSEQPFIVFATLLVVHGYFWLKFVDSVRARLKPPAEITIGLLVGTFLLETLILNLAAGGLGGAMWFLGGVQMLVLAALVLLWSLILVQNTDGKKGVLIVFILMALLWTYLFRDRGFVYHLLFQLLLFIWLLKKTGWLEELTRIECWIYFIVAFVLFQWISDLALFEAPGRLAHTPVITAAFYFYWLLKIYLLAILVKIPVVLVYNHARLSRKLWISSLFQSTFPQVIQLAMLLVIFFFFISGWQAEKTRQAITEKIDLMRDRGVPIGLSYRAFSEESRGSDGLRLSRRLPDEAIISSYPHTEPGSRGQYEYWLFFRAPHKDSVYVVRLDTTTLRWLTRDLHVLAGSLLYSYPYLPNKLEAHLFDMNFWRSEGKFQVFPFGLAPQRGDQALVAPIETTGAFLDDDQILRQVRQKVQFTLGRLYAPLFDREAEHIGYFALDVAVVPDFMFVISPIFRYTLFLVAVYLLVNFFVIRRVVKLGTEINKMIVQKFNQLQIGIRQISSGNLDYKVHLEGDDEFVELATRFNQMGDRLKETIAEAREKDRLQHELTIAREVQLSLLPPELPQVPGYEIAATLRTANEVGGDFYDVVRVDDDRLLCTVGDVSGKGMSAAFYMAQCISLMRYSHQFTTEPREIALRLNRYFSSRDVDRRLFITDILGLLDARRHILRLVRAGHTVPLLVPGQPEKPLREITLTGLGLGLERQGALFEKKLQAVELKLQPGDLVVLYTDGLVEASRDKDIEDDEGGAVEFYGEERLMRLLEHLRGRPAEEVVSRVVSDIDAFYGTHAPVDDYTLLILRRL